MRRPHRAIHPILWALVGLVSAAFVGVGLKVRPAVPANDLPPAVARALSGEG